MGMDIFECDARHISYSHEDADALLDIAAVGPQEWLVTVGAEGMPPHITKKLKKLGRKDGDVVSVIFWH